LLKSYLGNFIHCITNFKRFFRHFREVSGLSLHVELQPVADDLCLESLRVELVEVAGTDVQLVSKVFIQACAYMTSDLLTLGRLVLSHRVEFGLELPFLEGFNLEFSFDLGLF